MARLERRADRKPGDQSSRVNFRSAPSLTTVTLPLPSATQCLRFQVCRCLLTIWRDSPRNCARSSCESVSLMPAGLARRARSRDSAVASQVAPARREASSPPSAARSSEPLAQQLDQVHGKLRLALEQCLKVLAPDDDQLRRCERRGGRSARLSIEQCDLAECIARLHHVEEDFLAAGALELMRTFPVTTP